MNLVISMLSPVAEDSSKILLWTFFSTRLTKPAPWASLHTSHAPALTTLDSSVWHNPYCPREPKPGTALQMCPQVSRRGTSPSPLPAGHVFASTAQQERPVFNATMTRWWHTLSFQCLANPSMQSVPSLSSCTAVTSQGQDQNLTMLSCRPPGLMALFPISSATALPISCQHRLAGAVLEHYSYEGFLSEITNQPRCKSSQKTSTKGCHFSK